MAGINNTLSDRMKTYENVSKNFLMKKTPVIIRLDGRSFHQFTKGLNKPFDRLLNTSMAKTAQYLLDNISGCVFGYTQSDEISLLLIDTQDINTEPMFSNNQQKLVSISASIATLAFNKFWDKEISQIMYDDDGVLWKRMEGKNIRQEGNLDYLKAIKHKRMQAIFDSRAFNLPEVEINNYFVWRQEDATKNSITMLAQAHFSHKELHCKNGSDKQDMLMVQKGINWNDIETRFKRGIATYKKEMDVNTLNGIIKRKKSFIDYETPIFKQQKEFILNKMEETNNGI